MTDEQRQIERLTFWMGRDAAEAYAEAMTAKRLAEEAWTQDMVDSGVNVTHMTRAEREKLLLDMQVEQDYE